MAESAEAAGFWLPSEFLDDFVVGKENLIKNNPTESDSELCFPTKFPYDFGTKNEKLLEKRWVMSTSPQSTLCHSWAGRSGGGSTNGSPNGFISPPATPKTNAVGDLVYLAAGQVERLKLHGGGGGGGGPTKVKTFLAPPRSLDQLHRDPSVIPNIYLQQMVKQQMQPVRMGQHAWPVERNPTRVGGRAAVFGGGGGAGAAVKRGCAGTGVFLPRRYGNGNNNNNNINNNNKNINNNNNNNICNAYASDSRKKQGYSVASIPKRNFHGLNKNLENMTGFAQPQPHYQPKLDSRGFVPDYDLLMARRNALMLQHQRSLLLEGSSPMNHTVYLPQEWTY